MITIYGIEVTKSDVKRFWSHVKKTKLGKYREGWTYSIVAIFLSVFVLAISFVVGYGWNHLLLVLDISASAGEIGNQAQNMADMARKGRSNHGSKCHFAKLKESDIPKIRLLRRSGFLQREIAEKFGINKSTIWSILAGKTWRRS